MQRKLARENAFMIIFESICKKDETAEEIFAKATQVRGLEFDDYVRQVFFGAYENAERIDGYIEKNLTGWKKTRITPISMAILHLACYEMLFLPEIPCLVSINEAIELSKKFDDDKSYTFVNGVLNAIAKQVSEEKND